MKTLLVVSLAVACAACQNMKHDSSCPPSKQKCAMSGRSQCTQMQGSQCHMKKR